MNMPCPTPSEDQKERLLRHQDDQERSIGKDKLRVQHEVAKDAPDSKMEPKRG